MEFSAPVTFDNPFESLSFNRPGDDFFLKKCDGMDGAEIRVPTDPRAQRDGGIVHPGFMGQMFPVIQGYFRATDAADRATKEDTLKGAVYSCKRADGQWSMTQSGQAERGITVRQFQPVVITPTDGIVHDFQFGLITSRQPTWLDTDAIETTINSGDTETITNGGNTDQWPVITVFPSGASTAFTLHNLTTGLNVVCSANAHTVISDIDAPARVVVDLWALTIKDHYSGSPTSGTANMMDWLHESTSDFWWLAPGDNDIKLTGDFDHCVVESHNAWV